MTWQPAGTVCTCRVPLIDRVRAVLEREPAAPLGRVQWLVGDNRPELVATLMRMVQLRGARGSVRASTQTHPSRHTCANVAPAALGSLPASRTGARGR